ncbi:hypothetical protein [Salmonella enterica]|uniref:hypothetical protein n=1 Tax=Salmonella enterica TaxID=28901 RepID=UPI00111A8015|nr:hypothetical protein [Salmonella enterica]EDW7806511.1 hypothetical protein [Salmonella enterica]
MTDEIKTSTREEYYEWAKKYITQGRVRMGNAWERASPDGKKARFVAMLQTDMGTEDIILYVAGDPDDFMARLKIHQVPPIVISLSSEIPEPVRR